MPIQSRVALSLALVSVWQLVPTHLVAAPDIQLEFAADGQADAGDARCKQINAFVKAQVANGKLESAEAAVNAALASASVPPHGVCAAVLLNNLAVIMLDSGRLAEAVRYAERSLNELEKIYRPSNLVLLRPLYTLCAARLEERMLGPARQVFRRIQAIPVVRPEDRALVSSLAATIFAAEHKDSEAEAAYLDALAAMQEANSLNTANAAVMMEGLGNLYMRQRRFKEAQRELDRASTTLHEARDTLPGDAILILNFQALLHEELGEWHDADADLVQAMSIAREHPQLDPSMLKSLLANYAFMLRHMHRRREARRVEANIAAIKNRRSAVVDLAEFVQAAEVQNKK